MSPEQFTDPAAVDHRTDIWSLGIVLYEGLTGALPFSGETFGGVCTNVLQTQPPKVESLRADVPNDLSSLVEKCLAKDARQRFQSVHTLARSLAPHASERGRRALAMVDTVSTRVERTAETSKPSPQAGAATVTALDAGTLSAAAPATRAPAESADPKRRSLLMVAAMLGLALIAGGVWAARFRPSAPISDSLTRTSAPTLATEVPTPLPSASASARKPALETFRKTDASSENKAETPAPSLAKRVRPRPGPATASAPSAAAAPSVSATRHFDPVFDERR
jgi:serine/threonine-protein kinase